MPANQSTPEVTRAEEARRLIGKLAAADIDVSGTAAIGITSADIIAANDWLSATPARGGDELREAWNEGYIAGHASTNPANHPTASDMQFDWEQSETAALASTDMAGAGEKVDGAPERIWLCGFDTDHGDISWSADKDPTGDPDVDGKQVEYVRAAPPVEGLTSGEEIIPRRLLDDDEPHGYRESDRDFVMNNLNACVAFLEGRASPKATATATATASVREGEAMRNAIIAGIVSDRRRFNEHSPTWNAYGFCIDIAEHATLTDSGTAATIGGERA